MIYQNRESYSVHFGSPTQEAKSYVDRPFKTKEEAKAARDKRYKELKAEGYNPKRSVLKGQLRKYWSFGNDCGITSDCYELSW